MGVGSVAMSPEVGSVSLPLFLFFGDEQQAIFSFMGAKLATLNKLKEECKHTETPVFLGHISRNGVNLRFVKCVNCGYEWGQ